MPALPIGSPGAAADRAAPRRHRWDALRWALQLLERLAASHNRANHGRLQPKFFKYPPV